MEQWLAVALARGRGFVIEDKQSMMTKWSPEAFTASVLYWVEQIFRNLPVRRPAFILLCRHRETMNRSRKHSEQKGKMSYWCTQSSAWYGRQRRIQEEQKTSLLCLISLRKVLNKTKWQLGEYKSTGNDAIPVPLSLLSQPLQGGWVGVACASSVQAGKTGARPYVVEAASSFVCQIERRTPYRSAGINSFLLVDLFSFLLKHFTFVSKLHHLSKSKENRDSKKAHLRID